MSLNFTTFTIISLISMLPLLFAIVIAYITWYKERFMHLLYLALSWSFLGLTQGSIIFSDLFVTENLVMAMYFKLAGYIIYIPFTYLVVLLADSVSRSKVDIKKILIMTILNTAIIINTA